MPSTARVEHRSINEDRLFSLLPHFFRHPSGVLAELAQNAARAGAKSLSIGLSGGRLTAEDDGAGAGDPAALVVLAESDWTPDVEANQMPAGWGLFFLMCISDRVAYRSRFGEIRIDCNRFLKDKEYRADLLLGVDKSKALPRGFRVEADLKPEVHTPDAYGTDPPILRHAHRLAYFPLSVSVNGEKIDPKNAGDGIRHDIATKYMGNAVYIRVGDGSWAGKTQHRGTWTNKNQFHDGIFAVWYGIPVNDCNSWDANVAIDVTCGNPVTPVLPYREALREDEALERLLEFCRQESVLHCRKIVEDPATTDTRVLVEAMDALANMGAQKDLDSLPRFYVRIRSKNHGGEFGGVNETRIVRPGDVIPPDETATIREVLPDGKTLDLQDPQGLSLDEPVVFGVKSADRTPSWLVVEDADVAIEVHVDGEGRFLRNHWQKARKILVDGKERGVSCAGMRHEDYGVMFYYTGDPRAVLDISDEVFRDNVYSDDCESDSMETQEQYFNEGVGDDLAEITQSRGLALLLGGLESVGINPRDVRGVAVDMRGKKMTVTLKGKKTRVVSLI